MRTLVGASQVLISFSVLSAALLAFAAPKKVPVGSAMIVTVAPPAVTRIDDAKKAKSNPGGKATHANKAPEDVPSMRRAKCLKPIFLFDGASWQQRTSYWSPM